MLESKPTSMPPSPLSRTIGNFAMITIRGTQSSSRPVIGVPCRTSLTVDHGHEHDPEGEHGEVEPAAARQVQRSERSCHGSSGSWTGMHQYQATGAGC